MLYRLIPCLCLFLCSFAVTLQDTKPKKAASNRGQATSFDSIAAVYIDSADKPRLAIDSKTFSLIGQADRINAGNFLYAYTLHVYNDKAFVGTYSLWNEWGSHAGGNIELELPNLELKTGYRIEIKQQYFDVAWHAEAMPDDQLKHWFEKTWWIFNSVVPRGKDSYDFVLWGDKRDPDLESHIRSSGIKIFAIYESVADVVVSQGKPSWRR